MKCAWILSVLRAHYCYIEDRENRELITRVTYIFASDFKALRRCKKSAHYQKAVLPLKHKRSQNFEHKVPVGLSHKPVKNPLTQNHPYLAACLWMSGWMLSPSGPTAGQWRSTRVNESQITSREGHTASELQASWLQIRPINYCFKLCCETSASLITKEQEKPTNNG